MKRSTGLGRYQPALLPSWTSHGHTTSGGAVTRPPRWSLQKLVARHRSETFRCSRHYPIESPCPLWLPHLISCLGPRRGPARRPVCPVLAWPRGSRWSGHRRRTRVGHSACAPRAKSRRPPTGVPSRSTSALEQPGGTWGYAPRAYGSSAQPVTATATGSGQAHRGPPTTGPSPGAQPRPSMPRPRDGLPSGTCGRPGPDRPRTRPGRTPRRQARPPRAGRAPGVDHPAPRQKASSNSSATFSYLPKPSRPTASTRFDGSGGSESRSAALQHAQRNRVTTTC